MTYFRLEIVPAANRFFDAESNGQPDYASTQQPPPAYVATYAERVAQYENERKPPYGTLTRADDYPRHEVHLPGDDLTLVYDSDLYSSLVEIYILHGPEGLDQVSRSLKAAAGMSRPAYEWSAALPFFLFTHNLLLLVIRDSLNDIEQKAWAVIFSRLSSTKLRVEEEVRRLRFSVRTESVPDDSAVGPRDTPRFKAVKRYSIGDTGLADSLYTALQDAVATRFKVLEAQEQYKRAEEALRLRRVRGPGGGARGGAEPSSASRGGTGGGNEEAALDPRIVKAWLSEATAAAEPKYTKAFDLCSFAPSAALLLKAGFSRADMEQTLGATMAQVLNVIDETGAGLKNSSGWVIAKFRDLQPGERLENLFPPNLYLEAAIADLVVSHADQIPYLTLLSEEVLSGLIEAGTIAADSFGYVVCTHYKRLLRQRLATEQVVEIQITAAFGVLSKLASILSVALLYWPTGPILKFVSTALGIGLLAYQSYSIAGALARVDAELSINALALDLENADSIARLNELATLRGDYLDGVSEAVTRELLLLVASRAWVPFKALLDTRAYFADLENIVGVQEPT